MKIQIITALAWGSNKILKVRENIFAYRKDKKYHWLQNICFRILKRLNCYYIEETIEYYSYNIDGDEFMDRLLHQYDWLSKEFQNQPTCVIMGARDFDKLMLNKRVTQHYFKFATPYD